MTKRCPYTFPARSRKAMIAYLAEHESYVPMNTWNGGFVLAWNVKIYNFDASGKAKLWERYSKSKSEFKPRANLDAGWEQETQEPEFFYSICEDAARMYLEGEWTNYPGIEQGEWKFSVNGRSGGYFILTEAPRWLPAPRAWRMFPMIWDSRGAYEEWLANLDTPTLKRFYRAVRVLDHDLARDAVEAEISYQVAFRRQQWEETQEQEEQTAAEEQEDARPDLYGS